MSNKRCTPPLVGYKSKKAAQISAYFAARSVSPIAKLKLIKLIYLSERQFLDLYGQPMLYDELFSLPHGPVCSNTLDAINGKIDSATWSNYIAMDGNNITSLVSCERDVYDELSDAEMDVLQSMWESFGWMTASQVRNYTHKHCPEYTEISMGRIPIYYKSLFKALGVEDSEALENEIINFRKEESLFLY